MHVTSILVGPSDAATHALVNDAARAAFPDAVVAPFPAGKPGADHPVNPGNELVVFPQPDPAAVNAAVNATDPSGARRWGVVVFGAVTAPDGIAVTVPLADRNPAAVAAALTSAARIHELELENFRLRGDLSTLGRRISHDLRAPLGGIYSACDAINEITPGSPADPRLFTQSITSSVDELVQLIDRVSFILKASAEPATKEQALMGEIVFSALQRLEKQAHKADATITQATTWPVVFGLPSALEMMWSSLLRNAIQHGGPRPHIELGWNESPAEFRFWVDDRGPGVRPDRVNRLFQPFNLLHRLNATRGLGLSLVQRLAEIQGGTSGYEPRPGGGARFYFTLPTAGGVSADEPR